MTKPKLYRKRMWAVVNPAFYPLFYSTKATAKDRCCTPRDRVIPVLVSEIPAKSKGLRK